MTISAPVISFVIVLVLPIVLSRGGNKKGP